MKKITSILVLAFFFCAGCATKGERSDIDFNRPHLKITLVFNPEKYHSMMLMKFYPSYALWVEDKRSGAVRTVFVTGKAGKNKWMMADERPSSLPVWFGVSREEKKRDAGFAVDAVTSATPSGKMMTLYWQVPEDLLNKKIDLFLEGNLSFDYNAFYKKDAAKDDPGYSDVNGQPSLVWKASVETGRKPLEDVKLLIIGHGHVLGANHAIDTDMTKITTAKDIFIHMDVSYQPGKGK